MTDMELEVAIRIYWPQQRGTWLGVYRKPRFICRMKQYKASIFDLSK